MDNSKILFKEFILDIGNFDQFNNKIQKSSFNNKCKGDFFELFASYFINYIYSHNIEGFIKYVISSDLTNDEKRKNNLPARDEGVDGVVFTDHITILVQVKYRTNKKNISRRELSTFILSCLETHINEVLLVTTCPNISHNDKNIDIDPIKIKLVNDFQACNIDFWDRMRRELNVEQIEQDKCIDINLYQHQQDAVSQIVKQISNGGLCRLCMFCGTGKTLVEISTILKMNIKSFIVIVPYLSLMRQITNEYNKFIYGKFLIIDSANGTTDIDKINHYLDKHHCFEKVFVTYQSSNLLHEILNNRKQIVELTIFDEAHHCIILDKEKLNHFVSQPLSKRSLFVTATEKISYGEYSMSNEILFGPLVYNYSCCQAIEDNIICDFEIVVAVCDKKEIVDLFEDNYVNSKGEDWRLILTIWMIKQILETGKNKKILAFSNNRKEAKALYEMFKNRCPEVYAYYLDGNNSTKEREDVLIKFRNDLNGFISNVDIFSEGIDERSIDTIVLSSNCQSVIDIIQRIGRAMRKDYAGKIAKIIIPCLLEDNEDFFNSKKHSILFDIINQLGLGDKIEQKIKIKRVILNNLIKEEKEQSPLDDISKKYTLVDDETFLNEIRIRYYHSCDKDPIREFIRHENKIRLSKNIDLIDTKNKCQDFIDKNKEILGSVEIKSKPKNWLKYCLGEYYKEYVKKYYTTIEEVKNACIKLFISSWDDYCLKYQEDDRLPPFDYINDGLYSHEDPKLIKIKSILINNINDY